MTKQLDELQPVVVVAEGHPLHGCVGRLTRDSHLGTDVPYPYQVAFRITELYKNSDHCLEYIERMALHYIPETVTKCPIDNFSEGEVYPIDEGGVSSSRLPDPGWIHPSYNPYHK